MKSRHIINRVREAASLRFVLILILNIIIGAIGAFTIVPYFMAKLNQPLAFTIAELESYTSSESLRFVRIEGSEMFDIGFESTNTLNGVPTRFTHFGALQIGDRLLIIASPTPIDTSQLTYIGTLNLMPSNIKREILDVLIAEDPDLYEIILPLSLDLSGNLDNWVWLISGIVWFIPFVICFGLLIQAIIYLQNPKQHSILKTLSRYGDINDVMAEIEGELFGSEKVEKFETSTLSKNWLSYELFGSFRAVRYDSIVWFHKTLSRHSVNGVETGVVAGITIYDDTGERTLIGAQTYAVDIILESIYQRTPWAISGYSPSLLQIWENEPEKLIGTVKERKAKMQAEN